MCGLCGFAGNADRAILGAMARSLAHRGPDEQTVLAGDGFGFGFRRLSIVDPAGGTQPFEDEDRTIAVVFNGEIYNHDSLRRDLMARGHVFRSDHADGEVIAHLYQEHGDNLLEFLDGMFAIALWDRRRRRLLLARDRLGIKPLYLAHRPDGTLLFGSEPKAILASGLVSRQFDAVALHHYLSLRHIPAPFSAFRDLGQLGPGELAVWQDGALSRRRWWSLPVGAADESMDEDEAASAVLTLLTEAVGRQMRADVPVGAYLSGGLDSSAVVALAARQAGARLKTFTLVYDQSFAGKDADRDHARRMAASLGTDHHEHVVVAADVASSLDRIVGAFDEPFAGVTSTYFMTECIGRHVKVALSGDGADEMFGSYLPHRMARPLEMLRRAGGDPRRISAADREGLAPYGDDPGPLIALLAEGGEADIRMRQFIATDHEKLADYTPAMRDAVATARTRDLLAAAYDGAGGGDALNRALAVEIATMLPDQVLAFVDRLSMAHSVEVRPPFLDHRLVEFVARRPGRMKIIGGRVKHLLKRAVEPILPHEVIDRPKEGFVMPLDLWLTTELKSHLDDWLDPAVIARMGILHSDAVPRLRQRAAAGDVVAARRLWSVVMLNRWWLNYAA